ncbi:MAG: cytochrome P450 [Halioglobus sp.]|jgi:cytochrome P450
MSNDVADIDLFDPDIQENWYPSYIRLQEQAPICFLPKQQMYIATKYEDIHYIVRNPEIFSNQQGVLTRDPLLAHPEARAIYEEYGFDRMFPLSADPPIHKHYRKLIENAFSRNGIRKFEPFIKQAVTALIDQLIHRREIEFIEEFCAPLPRLVIATILGFPVEDIPQLVIWSAAWVRVWEGELTKEEQLDVARKGVDFQNYIIGKVREKRENPQHDLISELAHASLNGERPLEDDEIISIIDHLFIGGNETTTFAIASGMWLLVENPEQMQKVREDRSLLKNMVEEVLRLESPTQGMPKIVMQDVELSGVTLPKGALVHLRYGAANRDPDKFECPHAMDVTRENAGSHMAFSQSIHSCPGATLSRVEMFIAFEQLLDRLDDIEFTTGKNDFTHAPGIVLRALNKLYISYRPAE